MESERRRLACVMVLGVLLLTAAGCQGGLTPSLLSSSRPTLMPTAALPSELAAGGSGGEAGLPSPAAGDPRLPPTWTPTLPPVAIDTPTPAASATTYRRTATPTVPTRTPSVTPTPSNTPTETATPTPWPTIAPDEIWTLDRYPRPPSDNGWGMHWFSTYEQDPYTINRFVVELQRMHIRWLVLLNDGVDIGRNDYLVRRLVTAGIMPVMRLYIHGVVAYEPGLGACVRHYRELGVHYFQLYNEPNLYVEAGGREPNPDWYVANWASAAEVVVANGGLPGFGSLSPGGSYNDLVYLRRALQSLVRRRQEYLLNQGWISIHNYANYQPVESSEGFGRFRLYDQIVAEELGRSLPILGTEAGHYGDLSEQFLHVSAEYRYLAQREPYLFCHSYWLLGSQIGGSADPSFEYQALFRVDGFVNPLVAGFFYLGP